ncbi:hypothetical protein LINGRAHAP2_LOCUS14769 [Linum grandiflorum]
MPRIFFLIKPLVTKQQMEPVRVLSGFEACFVVDANDHSGSKAFLWRFASQCVLVNFSQNFITL